MAKYTAGSKLRTDVNTGQNRKTVSIKMCEEIKNVDSKNKT